MFSSLFSHICFVLISHRSVACAALGISRQRDDGRFNWDSFTMWHWWIGKLFWSAPDWLGPDNYSLASFAL